MKILKHYMTFNQGLKVLSHQIRLGLKCYAWIGLCEYKDRWR